MSTTYGRKPVTADVVVACLVAGVGAWAAEVTVGFRTPMRPSCSATGHATPSTRPTTGAPMVTLTIPMNMADDPEAGKKHRNHVVREGTFSPHGRGGDANVTLDAGE